jgi:hypothetical protein
VIGADGFAPLALALAVAALPVRAQPPVWTVRDHDSVLVIFGAVHVLPKGLDWRPAMLDRAVTKADDIWFEVPMNAAADDAARQAAAGAGLLAPGSRLSVMLSRTARARLEATAERLDLDPRELDRMRPWYAELTLSSAFYRSIGADLSEGVEHAVLAEASTATRVRAFESPAQQVAIYAGTPMRDQIASLESTLRQMQEDPDAYRRLVRAWMAGDAGLIDREAVMPLRTSSPRLYARLVARRNRAWAEEIVRRLHGSGRTVVVVGVGHLVGRDGIPALLRARGLDVEGPR